MPSNDLVYPNNGDLTPVPVGSSETLIWKGGSANSDPTVAANWDPAVAPQMGAGQTLVMNSGTINLGSGNLAANQLNVSTPADKTATVNMADHGSLDVNVPNTAIPNLDVNMKGGGEGVFNLFAGMDSDPDVNVTIDASKLDLQANMWFGKLDVTGSNGGSVYLQGDSHLHGSSVQLHAGLDGYGSVELSSSGVHPGRMELFSQLPAGVAVNVLDHDPSGGANGMVFDKSAVSTTPSGPVSLQDGFVKLLDFVATSYTQNGNEYDLYQNGVMKEALTVSATPGSSPLQVGTNANGTYVYNADPAKMPLGAGNGLGNGPGTGGGNMMTLNLAGSTLTPLPLQS